MPFRLRAILPFCILTAGCVLTSGAALADPSGVIESRPGVMRLAVHTIYGRPNKPMVVIEVRIPSAAAAAAAAHKTVRDSLLERAEPTAMRSR